VQGRLKAIADFCSIRRQLIKKAAHQVKSGLFQIWLHKVDEFRNCFLYENVFETNLQFQAVELAIARVG
jgi:hypothetical protein